MAYLYIDDGSPEAADYNSNYIEFDASDPKKIRELIKEAKEFLQNYKRNTPCSPSCLCWQF